MEQEERHHGQALQSADAARKSALALVNFIRAQMQPTESTLRGDGRASATPRLRAIAGTVVRRRQAGQN